MNESNDYERENVVEVSQFVRWIRRFAITIPPIFFMYLQFRGVDIKPIISDITAEWIRRISLFVYYFCWVAGSLFDIHKQEAVYVSTPVEFSKKVKINTILFAVFLTAGFLILCWVGSDYKKLSIFLGIFWMVNFLGWFAMKRIVTPSIKDSYNSYNKERKYPSYFKLTLVDQYIRGNWQIYRFVVGLILITIFIILSFYYPYPLILSLAFLLFILFMEGWIYLLRFKLNTLLGTPKKIRESGFELIKIASGVKC